MLYLAYFRLLMSQPLCIRVTERTRRLIEHCRGTQTISAWVRAAIKQRLEEQHGVTADLAAQLAEHNKQLRGIGTNINQLARHANEGRPVTVSDQLLLQIDAKIRESRTLVIALSRKLP